MSRSYRSRIWGMGVLVILAALAGCGLPTSGVVHTIEPTGSSDSSGSFDFEPRGPRPGDDQAAIVSGFLDSLLQSPLTYSVARQYLTKDARERWQPSKRTVVYDDGTLLTDVSSTAAELTVGHNVELDGRGSWRSDLPGSDGQSFDLRLQQEDNEWRIAELPDALIVPNSHFESRFRRFNLYFLDPTGKALVPEPVYLPTGLQTATLLVAGLLEGPSPEVGSVERSYIPPGTELDLSVLVDDGVAEIPLDERILTTDAAQLDLAMAQLAWTLRQVPGVTRMRVTIDGAPAQGPAGTTRSVLGWEDLDPSGPQEPGLYAFQGDQIVSIEDDHVSGYSSAFGGLPMRSLAVAATSTGQVAGVTADGQHVYSSTAPGPAAAVYEGKDVLRPAYDRFGVVWLVDRTSDGAKISVIADNGRYPLVVAGVTGKTVTAFEVSRDGSRFAALVDGQLRLSRVSRSETGAPTALSPSTVLPFSEDGLGTPLDLAWIGPVQLGVLVDFGSNTSRVLIANVDGSVFGANPVYETVFQPATDLVGTPSSTAPLFLRVASGVTYQASLSGHWTVSQIPQTLTALTYSG